MIYNLTLRHTREPHNASLWARCGRAQPGWSPKKPRVCFRNINFRHIRDPCFHFIRSLITCMGQSTCNFLANILLWHLDIFFNDFNCFWVPPACLTFSFEQQDKYLISEITREVTSRSKAGSWGLGWEGFGPPGFNACHRWGLTVMNGHSTQTHSSA